MKPFGPMIFQGNYDGAEVCVGHAGGLSSDSVLLTIRGGMDCPDREQATCITPDMARSIATALNLVAAAMDHWGDLDLPDIGGW